MIEVDQDDMHQTANLIWGCLDRVTREQGADAATVAAIKNVHANVAWLREAVGDVDIIELLGEIREGILSSAFAKLRKAA